MKNDEYFFNYEMQPGIHLNKIEYENNNIKPLISIITSYYNANEYMWQTMNCIINQTFPYWEWIIVDDGSTKIEAIEYLEKIKKNDKRIKIFHKKNEGLAKGRDYAISKSSTDYILPLDADDLIEPTYIEILYWTLMINPKASWGFSNSLGFGKYRYLVNQQLDSEKMKTENQITATALIKKEEIIKLGGYGKANRYVNEDWHLWLRMLAEEKYPVQADFYGFWYRRREGSLLSQVNDEEKQENILRLKELKEEAKKIKKRIFSKIYPNQDNTEKKVQFNKKDFVKNKKGGILYIIPEIGYNRKVLNEIKLASEKKEIYIVSTENTKKSQYANRQIIEKYAYVYNLSSFLEPKYFIDFLEYLINIRKIEKIYISDICNKKYHISNKFCNIKMYVFGYKNSSLLYYNNIAKYKIKKLIIVRGIKKIINSICNVKRKDDKK